MSPLQRSHLLEEASHRTGPHRADHSRVEPPVPDATVDQRSTRGRPVLGPRPVVLLLGLFLFGSFGLSPTTAEAQFTFQRGDVNLDTQVDIADAIATLDGLFLGGSLPCEKAADANDDGSVNIADAISLLDYLFSGGPTPPAPFGVCGADPTGDALTCLVGGSCPPDVGANVPLILAGAPASGRPGTIVTLTGRNFSPVMTDNHVSFVDALTGDAITGLVLSVTVDPFIPGVGSPSTLTVMAPSGVRTGSIELSIDSVSGTVAAAGSASFTAAPVIRTVLVGDLGDQIGIARDLALNIFPDAVVIVGRNLGGSAATVSFFDGIQTLASPTVVEGLLPSALYTLDPALEVLTATIPANLLPNICTSSRLRITVASPAPGGGTLPSRVFELPYRNLDLGSGQQSDVAFHTAGGVTPAGILAGEVEVELYYRSSTNGSLFEWFAEYRDPADPTGQTWLPLSRDSDPFRGLTLLPLPSADGAVPEDGFSATPHILRWATPNDFPVGTGPHVTAIRVTPLIVSPFGPPTADPCATRFFSEDLVIDSRAPINPIDSIVEEFDDPADADPQTTALWDGGILTAPLGAPNPNTFGTGTLDLVLSSATYVFDTDTATLSEIVGGNPVDIAPGQPGQGVGEFHFRSLVIESSATIEVVGAEPLVIRLAGNGTNTFVAAELGALIGLDGGDALDALPAQNSLGAPGGPGGGSGGDGALMTIDPINFRAILAAPAGDGGGLGGRGGLSTEYISNSTAASSPRAGVAGGGGNRFRGDDGFSGLALNPLGGTILLVPSAGGPSFGDDTVSRLRGGGGGGGGGAAAILSTASITVRPGGGGGGGGGALEVVARGVVRVSASITARGGSGGKGSPGQQSGAGGGGAGGTIVLRATGDLELLTAEDPFDVAGGFGAFQTTSSTNPAFGGDGSPGRMRLETNGTVRSGGRASRSALLPFPNATSITTGFVVNPLSTGSGADGSFSDLLLPPGEFLVDTDNGTISDFFGSVYGVSNSGTGTFEFTDMILPANVTLVGRGTQPLVFRVQGDVRIEGTIDVAGLSGGIPDLVAGIPAAGGLPGAAGGAGGAGGFGDLVSATDGEDGGLPPTLPASLINPPPPQPGSPLVFAPIFPARGGASSVTAINCSGEPGGGGGSSTAGVAGTFLGPPTCPVQPTAGGTAFGTPSFVSGDPANPVTSFEVRAGGGGGAGGGVWVQPGVSMSPGSGGGGGGGFVEIAAGGTLTVVDGAEIDATGGDSYFAPVGGGNGAPGAGGSVRLRADGALIVESGATIDVRPGTRQLDPALAGLNPTYSSQSLTLPGNAANGRIRLDSSLGVTIVGGTVTAGAVVFGAPFDTVERTRTEAVSPAYRLEFPDGVLPRPAELLAPVVDGTIPAGTAVSVLLETAAADPADPARPGPFSPATADPSQLVGADFVRFRVYLYSSPTAAPEIESIEIPWTAP